MRNVARVGVCPGEYRYTVVRGTLRAGKQQILFQDSRRVTVLAAVPNTFAGVLGCTLRRKSAWVRKCPVRGHSSFHSVLCGTRGMSPLLPLCNSPR